MPAEPQPQPVDVGRADRAALIEAFGLTRIVWLGKGLVEDRDTDGHVDLIAAFIAPGRVLLQTVPVDNANHSRCEDNRQRLEAAGIEVVELPFLPYVEVAGERVAAGYLNLYVCNGAVIVPVTGAYDRRRGAVDHRRGVPGPRGRPRARRGARLRRWRTALHHPAGARRRLLGAGGLTCGSRPSGRAWR